MVVIYIQKKDNAKRIYCTLMNAKTNTDGYKLQGKHFMSSFGLGGCHMMRSGLSSVKLFANVLSWMLPLAFVGTHHENTPI